MPPWAARAGAVLAVEDRRFAGAGRRDPRGGQPGAGAFSTAKAGDPYFLQESGKHAWDHAAASPIAESDAKAATVLALAGRMSPGGGR
ncbi:MAG: hypothetical protein IPK26_07000 [Planctomycetes bacterium]|nr:hypothetical protein [Planctomycetota bacterium]